MQTSFFHFIDTVFYLNTCFKAWVCLKVGNLHSDAVVSTVASQLEGPEPGCSGILPPCIWPCSGTKWSKTDPRFWRLCCILLSYPVSLLCIFAVSVIRNLGGKKQAKAEVLRDLAILDWVYANVPTGLHAFRKQVFCVAPSVVDWGFFLVRSTSCTWSAAGIVQALFCSAGVNIPNSLSADMVKPTCICLLLWLRLQQS